ncbi:MAG: hypothetical protein F4X59_17550 [Holophagales bacterium]|nr:hypothetical protein [Holophagales bacterium]MYC11912.1 hypothetical protein [Holophagales bacterium]
MSRQDDIAAFRERIAERARSREDRNFVEINTKLVRAADVEIAQVKKRLEYAKARRRNLDKSDDVQDLRVASQRRETARQIRECQAVLKRLKRVRAERVREIEARKAVAV